MRSPNCTGLRLVRLCLKDVSHLFLFALSPRMRAALRSGRPGLMPSYLRVADLIRNEIGALLCAAALGAVG
jgi:hypothetical protein